MLMQFYLYLTISSGLTLSTTKFFVNQNRIYKNGIRVYSQFIQCVFKGIMIVRDNIRIVL